MQTVVIAILAIVAMAFALIAVWAVAAAHRAQRRFESALDGDEAMFRGQLPGVWREGYDQGVEDGRMAAEYNAGAPYEKVSANRANPYEVEETGR